jgi:hypothetical protein
MKAWIIEKELRGIRETEGHIVEYDDIPIFRTDYGDFECWFETKDEARNEAIKIKLNIIFDLEDEIKRLTNIKL